MVRIKIVRRDSYKNIFYTLYNSINYANIKKT